MTKPHADDISPIDLLTTTTGHFYVDDRFHIRNDIPLMLTTEAREAILAHGLPIILSGIRGD